MSDYMKEAERLADEYAKAVHDGRDSDCATLRAALLAHIQRGAVPEGLDIVDIGFRFDSAQQAHIPRLVIEFEPVPAGQPNDAKGWKDRDAVADMLAAAPDHFRDAAEMVVVHCTPTEHEGRIVYEHTDEPIPNADGFVLYAPVPDKFRNAAKMMAVQPACMTCTAPAPVEVLGETCIDGGECHHSCTDKCFRRECCVPLSGYTGPWAYAPAEVPMPEPSLFSIRHRDKSAKGVWYEWRDSEPTRWADHVARYKLEDYPADEKRLALFYAEDQLLTYGAACRAAGEAAGYARGLAEAGRYRHLRALVISDSYAATFQSLDQYRAALLKYLNAPAAETAQAALRGEVKP